MDICDLNSIISESVKLGFMEAIKTYEPSSDLIRQSEVFKWLKMLRVDEKRFRALIDAGVLEAKRRGTCKNSPKYFSKKEIMQALASARIGGMIANGTIRVDRC